MRDMKGAVPTSERSFAEFTAAMDGWDMERAERAAVSLARFHSSAEVFEQMWQYGARDYRNIGHKAIYVANACRTLQTIGWQHSEPVLRSLVLGLLDFGREQKVMESRRARMTGEEIEECGEVLAERVAAREEPQIAVDAARPYVVIPGGEMTIAPQAVGLLPDDEARLAVSLEAGAAVDDVSAHLLERTGPADIRLLIEARLQLDEDGDLLAVFDGRPQRVRDG